MHFFDELFGQIDIFIYFCTEIITNINNSLKKSAYTENSTSFKKK